MFRHVLSFGPVYADRVHAALSVYILLALTWAFVYGSIEIGSPGAFSLGPASADLMQPQGAYLLADMIQFQHRDADLDRLRLHRRGRSARPLDEPIRTVGGSILYRSSNFPFAWSLSADLLGVHKLDVDFEGKGERHLRGLTAMGTPTPELAVTRFSYACP